MASPTLSGVNITFELSKSPTYAFSTILASALSNRRCVDRSPARNRAGALLKSGVLRDAMSRSAPIFERLPNDGALAPPNRRPPFRMCSPSSATINKETEPVGVTQFIRDGVAGNIGGIAYQIVAQISGFKHVEPYATKSPSAVPSTRYSEGISPKGSRRDITATPRHNGHWISHLGKAVGNSSNKVKRFARLSRIPLIRTTSP